MRVIETMSPSPDFKARFDPSFFEDVKLCVLTKATTVKDEIGSPTIGPLARTQNEGGESPHRNSFIEDDDSNTPFNYYTSTPKSKPSISKKTQGNNSNKKTTPKIKSSSSINHTADVNLNDEPTVTRLLIDYEKTRQNEVQDAMSKRIEAMAQFEKEFAQKRERISAEWQAQLHAKDLIAQEALIMQLEEEDRRAEERRQEFQQQQELRAKRISIRNDRLKAAQQKVKEEEEEKKRKAAEKLKLLEEMQQIQQNYRRQYQTILNYLRLSKDKQAFMNHVVNLKAYTEGMEQLVQQCKVEGVSSKDLDKASILLKQLDVIHDEIKTKIEEQQRQEEEKQQQLQQQQQQLQQQQQEVQKQRQILEAEEQQLSQQSPSDDTSKNANKVEDALADCVDKQNLKIYLEIKAYQQNIEKSYDELLQNESLKKYRFECKKAINIPVNAISPVSAPHLADKLNKLSRLLSGQPVSTADNARVSASQHPAGIDFCQDLLAKKFVRQGDSTVSSKPEAAFAIAAVIVALWQEYPNWGVLVLAHFYNECPYLVPFFKPQIEGQTTKDYYKSLGYRYSEDGEVEKQDKFLKRMSGIMRLYAAVLITNPPKSRRNQPHPHGLPNGWRWLASVLNLDPRPDICATLIYDFLDVAGRSMCVCYGRQFQKLLVFLCKEYFPRLQKAAGSSSGPVVRLETFLQQILKEGRIESPLGALRPDFW